MSIRYRLFLIVGLLFTAVTAVTFFLESVFLKKSLIEARDKSNELYLTLEEQKRVHLQEFILTVLSEQLAKINALLENITRYNVLTEWFAPTSHNLENGTWNNAASLLQSDDWVGFLQNTSGPTLLSFLVPQKQDLLQVGSIPIQQGLSWMFVAKEELIPCIGIQIFFSNSPNQGQVLEEQQLQVYALYEWDKLASMPFPSVQTSDDSIDSLRIPFLQGYEIDQQRFTSLLSRAIALAKEDKLTPPAPPSIIKSVEPSSQQEPNLQTLIRAYLQEQVEYSNELFLMWQAAALQERGAFGLAASSSPDAMAYLMDEQKQGLGFLLKSVMRPSSVLFDAETYYKNNPPLSSSDQVASNAAVITSPHPNQIFIGNTAVLFTKSEENRTQSSFLTLGFDVSELLSQLVISSHKYGCIVSRGEIVVGLNPDGGRIEGVEELSQLLASQTSQKSGEVKWKGECYYFLCMQPSEKVDLFFFILTKAQDEFALINNFEEEMAEIASAIIYHRRAAELAAIVLLLILLLDLTKKITRPIVALSKSLQQVKTGDWDQIQIPKIKFKEKNEVRQLCDSFAAMVQGLKEKEKVTGILNKVVSPEIAGEILKGEVHLGGEEKVITIFFADIRQFTFHTQNMPPHEVIELLNTCMTKLSEVIDVNHGVIDKYIGDGIMALYGAPIPSDESCFRAVLSAVNMMQVLKQWNEERAKMQLFPIEIGVGIHTGSACVGNMGAINRLNYTAIGSNVNLASRLCYAAEPGEILITEDTLRDRFVTARVQVEDKGLMKFKGFDEEKRVYKVVGIESCGD